MQIRRRFRLVRRRRLAGATIVLGASALAVRAPARVAPLGAAVARVVLAGLDDRAAALARQALAAEHPGAVVEVAGEGALDAVAVREQQAAADAMKRVFYDKTAEMRDELELLAEENRRLKEAGADSLSTDELLSGGGSSSLSDEERRGFIAEVAGILKGKHERELAALDKRTIELKSALRESETRLCDALDRVELAERNAARNEAALSDMVGTTAALKGELGQSKAELEQSRAELEQSRAELEQSQAELERSKAELEQARAELEQSQAELEQARAELARAIEQNGGNASGELKEAKDSLAKMEARVSAMDAILSERELRLAAIGGKLEARQERIAWLERELETARSNAADETELRKRDDEIAHLADIVGQREVEMKRGDMEIARLNAVLTEREKELERMRLTLAEIAQLKERLSHIETPAPAARERRDDAPRKGNIIALNS